MAEEEGGTGTKVRVARKKKDSGGLSGTKVDVAM